MNVGLGRITAQLADAADNTVSSELIELINTNISPPAHVAEGDVYIRSMYIVSDQVNSFGGRFPVEEHERLTHLLIDSPVLIGHRKDQLPIARNFHSVATVREGRHWVRSYFFWMRRADGAETLRDNIDGGIYKECSIGFTFHLPQCSICGQDIRTCEHLPMQEYRRADGVSAVCHFDYRQIERVLETSLVYRGATPDTSMSKELLFQKTAGRDRSAEESPVEISDIETIRETGPFVVVPFYEGVPVTASLHDGELSIGGPDGLSVPVGLAAQFPLDGLQELDNTPALLVGFRGKERCSAEAVKQYLLDQSGPVSRLSLQLQPNGSTDGIECGGEKDRFSIRTIRHRIAHREQLADVIKQLATKHGVLIRPVDPTGAVQSVRAYHLKEIPTETDNVIELLSSATSSHARLVARLGAERQVFEIRQFNLARWRHGGRFIADRLTELRNRQPEGQALVFRSRAVIDPVGESSGIRLTINTPSKERIALRPVSLAGRKRYLFYLEAAHETTRDCR
ncbi:MAG: hypothetical protein AB1644_07230 [Candidatus Zixiibacteriota bacterium]